MDAMYKEDIIKKAESGNSFAQYELGIFYLKGDGVKKYINKEQAVNWLTLAANSGHVKALYELGMYYRYEMFNKAYSPKVDWLDLFKKSAIQGFSAAQYEVGLFYNESRDYNEALRWYSAAAELGHAEAQYSASVIIIYLRDQEDNIDKTNELWIKYIKLLELAADQNHPEAMFHLGHIYLFNNYNDDYKRKGFNLTYSAANNGDVRAKIGLAYCYEKGLGIIKDKSKAEKIYLEIFLQERKKIYPSSAFEEAKEGLWRVLPMHKKLYYSSRYDL